MKNVNKVLPQVAKKGLMSVSLAVGLAVMVSGCSMNTLKISKDFKEVPEVTRNNMTDAVSCMGSALKKGNSNSAYIFMVRDVKDGTVKDSVYQDGPLADAGRVQLMNVLSEHLYPHVGLVADNFPMMFSQVGKEAVGLNRFGLPSPQNMGIFMSSYSGIIQNARKAKRLNPARNVIPLVISGSFTRFDSDNLVQSGSGQNLGSRTKRLAENERDDYWRRVSGQADIGSTSSARAISLVMNLVDPRNNLVVSSQSFDLIFYRENKNFRLRIGVGDGYYGISKNNVVVEGVHGAQKVLLDAAALWLLNKAYGGQTNFSSCFNNAQRRLTMTAGEISQIDKRNLARQQAMVDKAARQNPVKTNVQKTPAKQPVKAKQGG